MSQHSTGLADDEKPAGGRGKKSPRALPPFGGSKTIEQFCSTNGISRSFYYKLKHAGLGPDEMRFGKAVRISARAEAAWQQHGESRGRAS
jgi:hypothetical protein